MIKQAELRMSDNQHEDQARLDTGRSDHPLLEFDLGGSKPEQEGSAQTEAERSSMVTPQTLFQHNPMAKALKSRLMQNMARVRDDLAEGDSEPNISSSYEEGQQPEAERVILDTDKVIEETSNEDVGEHRQSSQASSHMNSGNILINAAPPSILSKKKDRRSSPKVKSVQFRASTKSAANDSPEPQSEASLFAINVDPEAIKLSTARLMYQRKGQPTSGDIRASSSGISPRQVKLELKKGSQSVSPQFMSGQKGSAAGYSSPLRLGSRSNSLQQVTEGMEEENSSGEEAKAAASRSAESSSGDEVAEEGMSEGSTSKEQQRRYAMAVRKALKGKSAKGQGEASEHVQANSKTNLEEKELRTTYKIQKGFYMTENLAIYITKNRSSSEYFLELFMFNESGGARERDTVDIAWLLKSCHDVDIKVALCRNRRFASILIQEYVHSEGRLEQQTLFTLDSRLVSQEAERQLSGTGTLISRRASDISSGLNGGILRAGLVKVVDLHLPPSLDDTTSNKKPNTLLLLSNNRNRTETVLHIVLQYFSSKQEAAGATNSLSKSSLEPLTFVELPVNACTLFFQVNVSHLFAEKESLCQEQMIPVPIFERVTFSLDEGVEGHIVALFEHANDKNFLAVFEQGDIIVVDFNQECKFEQIDLPAGSRIVAVRETILYDAPMLVLQDQMCGIIGMSVTKECKWKREFRIEPNRFKLVQAYGLTLIAVSLQEHTVMCLEMAGANSETIRTQFALGEKGREDLKIDAVGVESDNALQFRPYTNNFVWYRFNQQRQFHNVESNYCVQLCEDAMIRMRVGSNKRRSIKFFCIKSFKPSARSLMYSVTMPPKIQMSKIRSFLPIQSPNKRLIVLAISFVTSEQNQWDMYKYQALVLIDVEARQAFTDTRVNLVKFSNLLFEDNDSLVLQQRLGLVRVKISSNKREIELQAKTFSPKIPAIPTFLASRSDADQTNTDEKSPQKLSLAYKLEVSDTLCMRTPYDSVRLCSVREGKIILLMMQDRKLGMMPIRRPDITYTMPDGVRSIATFQSVEAAEKEYQDNKDAITKGNMARIQIIGDLYLPTRQDLSTSSYLQKACITPSGKSMVVLFSNYYFAYLYVYDFDSDGALTRRKDDQGIDQEPVLVTQRLARGVYALDERQIVLLTFKGLAVVDLIRGLLTFKFNLVNQMNIDLTVSRLAIAVPRTKNGVIIEMGSLELAQACKEKNPHLSCYRDMNHIYAQFEQLFFLQTKGYLMIDEMGVNWSQCKQLPVKVMRRDYIVRRTTAELNSSVASVGSQAFEQGEPVDYKEFWVLQHKYDNQYNIFEALIRQAIIQDRIAINDSQLQRIINPVLSDNNRNVLHHLSYRRLASLHTIFLRTSISQHTSAEEKHFAFFLDFAGNSQLDYALEQVDLESFKFLLEQLISSQDGHHSSYLLDGWLIEALNLDIDLKPLFESKLCTQNLQDGAIKHTEQFPEFHPNKETVTVKFDNNMADLHYSQTTYRELFADKVKGAPPPQITQADRRAGSVQSDPLAVEGSENVHPIQYDIDFIFIRRRKKTQVEFQVEFIKALAKTKNMGLFQTKYVQRYIDFHWNHGYKDFLRMNMLIFAAISVLIYAAVLLVRHEAGSTQAWYRHLIMSLNGCIVLIYVPIFEIKQLKRQGCGYFSDVNNINDLLFLVVFVAASVCDFALGTTWLDSEHYQVTLILYAVLLLTGFVKLLNSMRIYNDISFIVRMFTSVMLKLVPFLVLFLSILLVFMFIQVTLGLDFHEGTHGEETAYTSGIGQLAYFFFLVRTSLGDFDVEPYAELPQLSQYVIWAFWLVIVFTNTIIFLNFLIAVITDVYEQIMETRTEEIFLKKAELLVEIIEVVGERGIEHNIATILVSRSKKQISQDNEWTGFFSELKRHMSHEGDQIQTAVQRSESTLLKQMDERHKETTEAIKGLSIRVEHLCSRFGGSERVEEAALVSQLGGVDSSSAAQINQGTAKQIRVMLRNAINDLFKEQYNQEEDDEDQDQFKNLPRRS